MTWSSCWLQWWKLYSNGYADACSSIKDWMFACDEKDNFVGHFYLGSINTIMFTNLSSFLYHLIGWMPNLNAKLVTRIAFRAVVDNHDVCPVHFRLQMLLVYYSIFPHMVILFGSTRFVSYWSFRILSSCQCQICQCKELLLIWLRLLWDLFKADSPQWSLLPFMQIQNQYGVISHETWANHLWLTEQT